jgi:hypothetical protein
MVKKDKVIKVYEILESSPSDPNPMTQPIRLVLLSSRT